MRRIVHLCLPFLVLFSCSRSTDFLLRSPEGTVQVSLTNPDLTPGLVLEFKGDTIINSSPIGLRVNGIDYSRNVSVRMDSHSITDETWNSVNGKQKEVRNHYHQYVYAISKDGDPDSSYRMVFRIYEDGFAYRYEFPEEMMDDSVTINRELTVLNIQNDYTYWAYNGEALTLGPVIRSQEEHKQVRIPVVLQLDTNRFMAIHEAEIVKFAPFSIHAAEDDWSLSFNTQHSAQTEPFRTSWRTFILGERAGDLVESDLLVNLNEPCKIADPSWIRPGKTMWDWRVWGYVAEDGFEYGLNTVSHKRFIDFASENNIQYLLLDADWYGAEFSADSDPTTAGKDVDIEECMAYANSKGVGIILYLNDLGAKNFGLERVLKQFSQWGAVGVKYGFMRSEGEEKVAQTRRIVEMCANYKLMVNFHDNPIPPSGDRRTWPNLITKEFGYSQADAHRVDFPEVFVNLVLVNSIAGPIDACNGWFGLNHAHSRVKVYDKIPTTVVGDLAKPVAIYTGLNVLPDAPEEYHKKDDLFELFRIMPGQFDSYHVLDGVIDEFVCVARRSGDDWFIASITNRDPRTLEIDFAFLPDDREYEATLYEDTEASHFLYNKEAYQIRTQHINSKQKLSIRMAPGGGHVIHLRDTTHMKP